MTSAFVREIYRRRKLARIRMLKLIRERQRRELTKMQALMPLPRMHQGRFDPSRPNPFFGPTNAKPVVQLPPDAYVEGGVIYTDHPDRVVFEHPDVVMPIGTIDASEPHVNDAGEVVGMDWRSSNWEHFERILDV